MKLKSYSEIKEGLMPHVFSLNPKDYNVEQIFSEFTKFLNGKDRGWWLRCDFITYTMFQSFCDKYGYEYSKLSKYRDKMEGVFKEWKYIELTYFED